MPILKRRYGLPPEPGGVGSPPSPSSWKQSFLKFCLNKTSHDGNWGPQSTTDVSENSP